ncbi:MAG: hypothetical protein JST84_30295 [Acidobacteria bacterium]|nr:hypothetical protein [Acidobacteriota bacterium]
MKLRFCLLTLIGCVLAFAGTLSLHAQSSTETIQDPEGNFTVAIPSALKPEQGWHAVEITDGAGRKQVEIIYKVREEGLLKVRRLEVDKGAKLVDVIKKDESQTLTFLPNYTKGAVEEFSAGNGRIPAMLTAYDFTTGGRPKKGRNYYLMVNDTTVYVLRFTGNRGTMEALRSQTDIIARSFKVK